MAASLLIQSSGIMNRTTTMKRKLIPKPQLMKISQLCEMGVPLNTILKKQQLLRTVSRPVVAKLLQWSKSDHSVVLASIFPEWLDDNGPTVQETPAGWAYVGFFPYGEWKQQ